MHVFPTLKSLWAELQSDDVGGLAAELSYQFLLALFPFLIFVTAVGALFAQLGGVENPTERLLDALGGSLPTEAESLLRTQIERLLNTQSGGLLSIGVVTAIWAASGGVRAMMKAMNRAYDVEETRTIWQRYGISIALVLGAGSSLFIALIVLLGGQVLGRQILEDFGVGSSATAWVNAARLPVVAVLVAIAVAFLYWAAPNASLPFRWVSPGAAVFVVSWLIATLLFGLYVTNFGSYNATYGALGGVVVLLLWAYLSAFLLLGGAELNAVLYKQAGKEGRGIEPSSAGKSPEHRAA